MIVSNGYRKYGFDAYGGKVLRKEDMGFWMHMPERTRPQGVCLELKEDVEEVEKGFFELLPTITELRIMNPDCRVNMDEESVKLFKKNNVLIRGPFDSAAESFAKKYNLRFLHADTKLAHAGDYFDRGVYIITLFFRSDGSAYINQDCRYQGSSAGNDGGGEMDFDLPKDFYKTMSAEDVADLCWGSCYSKIISNGILADLIAKARKKGGFLL